MLSGRTGQHPCRSNPEEEARVRVNPTPLKIAAATVLLGFA